MKRIGLIALFLIPLVAFGCAGSPTKGEDPAQVPSAVAASFTTSNLTVTPSEAKPGQRVMVGVTVTNTGMQQGTYSVVVKDHDGSIIGMQDVTLDGGANKDVTLHIILNKVGAHMIMVDNLEGNLEVQDAMEPSPNQPAATPPAQTTTPVQPPPAGTTAGFVVSALGLEPDMPDVGENITVVFKVTNNSGKAGTYHAEVKINGTVVATKDITLAAMETQAVNIGTKAPAKEGKFTLSVGDQSISPSIMAM